MAASRARPQFVGSLPAQEASVSLRDWTVFPLTGPASGVALPIDALAPASLSSYFNALFAANGPQHWWPGRTRFEVIVGAILTQNTSWTNVERAIRNLRGARLLSPIAIRRVTRAKLAALLRPSGYFRQKTKTLKSFVDFLYQFYDGSLSKMFSTPTPVLRDRLLNLHGIGPETADSILLYAGRHTVFVVDTYTRRLLERHGHAHPKLSYDEIRKLFESSLSPDPQLFNEFHALIVHTGKHFCRKRNPLCSECPLNRFLPLAQTHATAVDARRGPSPVTSYKSRVPSP